MPRGRLMVSYRKLEEILHLPEGSQIQWVEEWHLSPDFAVYIDHPDIPKVKPGQLFPELILTDEGEWVWRIYR